MIRSLGTSTFRRALIVIVAAGLLVVATPTLAGRGGQGGGGKVSPQGTEVCWVDPNPVSDGEIFTVQGNGFKPGQVLSIFVGSGGILMTAADSTGAFSAWSWASFRDPATVGVTIYQQGDRKKTVLTTCSFQASGTP